MMSAGYRLRGQEGVILTPRTYPNHPNRAFQVTYTHQ